MLPSNFCQIENQNMIDDGVNIISTKNKNILLCSILHLKQSVMEEEIVVKEIANVISTTYSCKN